jgi:hypothetical protein
MGFFYNNSTSIKFQPLRGWMRVCSNCIVFHSIPFHELRSWLLMFNPFGVGCGLVFFQNNITSIKFQTRRGWMRVCHPFHVLRSWLLMFNPFGVFGDGSLFVNYEWNTYHHSNIRWTCCMDDSNCDWFVVEPTHVLALLFFG